MGKLKKSYYLLKYYGLKTFLRTLIGYIRARFSVSQPVEYRILYEALTSQIGTDGVMVDVGAALGSASESFVRDGWQCFCFEPDFRNEKILVALFGKYPNVIIENRAVYSISNSKMRFYSGEKYWGVSSLLHIDDLHSHETNISVISLKDYWVEKKIPHINYLKIDTEGADFDVLKGFPWDVDSPDAILCEFDGQKSLDWTWENLGEYLHARGYIVLISEWYPVVKYGTNHRWRVLHDYPGAKISEILAWGNIIAVRDKLLYQAIKEKFLQFSG
jgi:FkbM family methyltransferase